MAIFRDSIGASKAVTVEFTATQWTNGTLTLTPDVHGRSTESFTYRLLMKLSNGTYSGSTWAVLETKVDYDAATGNIKLSCLDGGYNGKICFAG